jgi:hypothetical protein
MNEFKLVRPRWQRILGNLAICGTSGLVMCGALLAYILIGSDEKPPGWLYVPMLVGLFGTLWGLVAAVSAGASRTSS